MGMDCRQNSHAPAAAVALDNVCCEDTFHELSPGIVPRMAWAKMRLLCLRWMFPDAATLMASGSCKGRMKVIFAEILRELKASGYRVSARLMNAMCFGVPQSRERMVFIGVRQDIWERVQGKECA